MTGWNREGVHWGREYRVEWDSAGGELMREVS